MTPQNINRNLEKAGIYLNRFWTGLNTNRSPLFEPISAMGLVMINRQDAMWDGLNTEISPAMTLVRRYGYKRYSSEAFGSNDYPLAFYSYKNLSGTINAMVDTPTCVSWFNTTSINNIFLKQTTNQTSFQKVGDRLYWVDGTSAKKWDGSKNLCSFNGTTATMTSPWVQVGTGSALLARVYSDIINVIPGETYTVSAKIDATNVSGTPSPLVSIFDITATTTEYLAVPQPAGNNSRVSGSWTCPNGVTQVRVVFRTNLCVATLGQNVTWSNAQFEIGSSVTSYVAASNGGGVTNIGISSPVIAPIISYINNGQLAPTSGYSYVSCYANSQTGHLSTASPQSANTGAITNQTTIEGQVTVTVTATAFDGSNNATITCNNNFVAGQHVVCKSLANATWLNGVTLTVTSSTGSTFVATGCTHAAYTTATDTGQATMTVSIPSSPYVYTVLSSAAFVSDGGVKFTSNSTPLTMVASSPAAGQYSVNTSIGAYTFNSADAGKGIQITYTYSLAGSTGVNIQLAGVGSTDPQVDTIQIYRTADGGSLYYLVATINNTANWTYTDSTQDADLNNDIVAPVADANDPIPAGTSLLAWYAGRLWAASGNTLYFAAGPDTTNGVGAESWPPANNFPVPGKITALVSTSQGLVVCTNDNAYVVYGQDAVSFTVPQLWQQNFGVANQNCVCQDGDIVFFFTTRGQLFSFGGSLTEIGFPISKKLAAFTPANVYITLHRSGSDEGIFISDGTAQVYRYSMAMNCWSPVARPVNGVSAIGSIEVSTGLWALCAGRTAGSGYILTRDSSTFADDGTAYPAFAVVGSLLLAPPRQTAVMNHVLLDVSTVGTYPTLSVLLNEISGTFTTLPNPVPDPPELAASTTVWMKRHDLKAATKPLPQHVRHCQIRIDFGNTDTVQNELLGMAVS